MAAEPTSQPADSAVAHTGESTEAAQGGGGLPQFKFEYWGGQIVWLRKVLDLRAETIASAVDQAKKVQAEADAQAAAAKAEIEQARAASRAMAAEAKAKATAELNKRQAAEDERLAGELAQAEERIRGLRDAAMTNVSSIASETAQAIVERLTGAKASAAELKAAGQGAA
jgi:F-type H+-transporting ATPase subunit b